MEKTFNALGPFVARYTPQVPQLLHQLRISLIISTYQAGKLIFISPDSESDTLITLPRSFIKPMGIAIDKNKLAIATKDEIKIFENSTELAYHYPKKPRTYDCMYLPRITYYTGHVDMHDIAFSEIGLIGVNTTFSCLCEIDGEYNFKPIWKPNFITSLQSEDRCHLNGLAIKNGLPKYVTALGKTDNPHGWRENITNGGILIDIEHDVTILENLAMPHSPRIHDNKLYFLQSAKGELNYYKPETNSFDSIKKYEGFCRGLAIYEDYAFIGFSKLRKNSSTFAKLSFSKNANFAGIKIVHIPTKSEVGEIIYESSVDEIYEVCVINGVQRPNILCTLEQYYKNALSIPGKTFWATNNCDNL